MAQEGKPPFAPVLWPVLKLDTNPGAELGPGRPLPGIWRGSRPEGSRCPECHAEKIPVRRKGVFIILL